MATDSKVKVFGIGLNKTGTTTLGFCMKQLGYKHLSHSETNSELYYNQKFTELMNIARKYNSLEDLPWPLLYKQLASEFPEAKFILTVRSSPEKWYKSFYWHSLKLPPKENYHNLIYGYKYCLGKKPYYLDFYNSHNSQVIKYFESQPERLLVVCWEEISNFLKLDRKGAVPIIGASKDWKVSPFRYAQNFLLSLVEYFRK